MLKLAYSEYFSQSSSGRGISNHSNFQHRKFPISLSNSLSSANTQHHRSGRSAACKCNYHSSSHSERGGGGEALSLSTNIKAAPLLRPQFNGQPCSRLLRKHSKLARVFRTAENCHIVLESTRFTCKLRCAKWFYIFACELEDGVGRSRANVTQLVLLDFVGGVHPAFIKLVKHTIDNLIFWRKMRVALQCNMSSLNKRAR